MSQLLIIAGLIGILYGAVGLLKPSQFQLKMIQFIKDVN